METIEQEIEAKFKELETGGNVDCSLSNGLVRSSKEAYGYYDGIEGQPLPAGAEFAGYAIFHSIDGTTCYFTKQGLTEVFKGERSPWDGDNEEDE